MEEILAAEVPAVVPVVTEAVSQPSLVPTLTAIVKSTKTIPTSQFSPTTINPQPKLEPTSTAEITTPSPVPYATFDPSLPTPATAIPQAVLPLDISSAATNIVLLGNDVRWPQGGRTDAIMLVSINHLTGDISLLSIPRDLYVAIPGWTMNRINLALPHGHGGDYPEGGGALIKDTIRYNLGIPVDYYVRIGFDGFVQIVDILGSIEVPVNCPITDWRLKSGDLDPAVEENWELFALDSGVEHLDGELALWYARSRRTSNDFDRSRRQQKVLRAMWLKAQNDEAILNLPVFWQRMADQIETDLSLDDVMDLVQTVSKIDRLNLKHYLLAGEAVRPWMVPNTGEAVQLLNQEAANEIVTSFLHPSALRQANRASIKVVLETSNLIMYEQVADNLQWYGFDPILQYRETPDPVKTKILLQGSNLKATFPDMLSWVFRQEKEDIIVDNDNKGILPQYHVILGQDHNPCLPYFKKLNGDYENNSIGQDSQFNLAKTGEAN